MSKRLLDTSSTARSNSVPRPASTDPTIKRYSFGPAAKPVTTRQIRPFSQGRSVDKNETIQQQKTPANRSRPITKSVTRPPIPKTLAQQLQDSKLQNDENIRQLKALEEKLEEAVRQLEKNDKTIKEKDKTIEERDQTIEKRDKIIEEQARKLEDAKQDVTVSEIKARKCLNELLNLKGLIRIVTRTRPCMANEKSGPICYPSPDRVEIQLGKDKHSYNFQKVMGPNVDQRAVFDEVGELILSVLHGYNVAIIAYGQTGSGKTFTMRGGDDSITAGIIPRAIAYLFDNKERLERLGWTFELSAVYVEVYNDEVYDLQTRPKKKATLKTMGLNDTGGLTVKQIVDGGQIDDILSKADKNRSVATTKLNISSSRSHAIFKLQVRAQNAISNADYTSALHLVDLAGSESVKQSGAEGSVFKEATEINESLFHFQSCIKALLEQKFVPYRNRTLTKLLSSCLSSADSKTLVVINLNPSDTHIAETKRSLDFAKEMSQVEIKDKSKK